MRKLYVVGRDAFLTALEQGKKNGLPASIRWLSDETLIPEATLWACKYGTRVLSESHAKTLAEMLQLSPEHTKAFLLASKRAKSAVARELTLRERLAAPDASLRIDWLPYNPFSNGADQFVDKFLSRFFQLSGVKMDKPKGSPSTRIADRKAKVLAHETDIAVNLFCSLPRLKLLNFLLFPMRLSISAVIPTLFKRRRIEVQEKLLAKRSCEDLHVIVADWEVGYDHATAVAGLSRDSLKEVIESWDRGKMAEALKKMVETHRDPNGPIPVLLADEIMSLSVLSQLKGTCMLAFPLSTKHNFRNLEGRRDAPEYRLGLAIDREYRELSDYLDEALRFYLLTDTENVARIYAKLFDDLTTFVHEAIESQDYQSLDQPTESSPLTRYRLARDFSRYVLRLDKEGVEGFKDYYLPWSNILRRAHQLVCEFQARNRLGIRRQVEDTLRETVGAGFGKRREKLGDEWKLIKAPLEEEFDVALSEEDDSPESLEGIVSRVQTALLGSSPGTIQEVPIISAGKEHLPAIRDLFSRFAEEMRIRNTAADPIPGERELKTLLKNNIVLLAVLHGQFIGCVQVARFNKATARLTRLFVRRRWRKPRVAAALVWRAIEYASKVPTYTRIVIKETQTPRKVLGIFQRHGFEPVKDNPNLLEYPLRESAEP